LKRPGQNTAVRLIWWTSVGSRPCLSHDLLCPLCVIRRASRAWTSCSRPARPELQRNIHPDPYLSKPLPLPFSLFPVPCSLFPVPCSLLRPFSPFSMHPPLKPTAWCMPSHCSLSVACSHLYQVEHPSSPKLSFVNHQPSTPRRPWRVPSSPCLLALHCPCCPRAVPWVYGGSKYARNPPVPRRYASSRPAAHHPTRLAT